MDILVDNTPLTMQETQVEKTGNEEKGDEERDEENEIADKFKLAEEKLDELYELHDFFFTKNKDEKKEMLTASSEQVCTILDEIGEGANSIERARSAYIRGKALEVFEEYDEEAEVQLQQAVKLAPDNVDAWNTLGHCLWKKKDLLGAKSCYLSALEKSQNKKSLQQLSMVLRQIRGDSVVMMRNLVDSLARAKAAVELDLNDHMSWYVLGNAHMTMFFKASFNDSDMNKALQAYSRAEQLGGETNPDLFFNKANVLMYKERYQEAANAVKVALDLDPSLPAQDVLDDIEHWMSRVHDLYSRKGKLKAKKLLELANFLKALPPADGHELVSLEQLQSGENNAKTLHLKMILPIGSSDNPPAHFLCTDLNTDVVVLSVYHVDKYMGGSFTANDIITILNPFYTEITYNKNANVNESEMTVDDEQTSITYKCVQVFDPSNFLLNDKPVSKAFAMPTCDSDFFDK